MTDILELVFGSLKAETMKSEVSNALVDLASQWDKREALNERLDQISKSLEIERDAIKKRLEELNATIEQTLKRLKELGAL